MPQFSISKSCFNLVQRHAVRPFRRADGQADGTFVVDVTTEELTTVNNRALPGETFGETVERVLSERLR